MTKTKDRDLRAKILERYGSMPKVLATYQCSLGRALQVYQVGIVGCAEVIDFVLPTHYIVNQLTEKFGAMTFEQVEFRVQAFKPEPEVVIAWLLASYNLQPDAVKDYVRDIFKEGLPHAFWQGRQLWSKTNG